jgi:DNA modification methylase
MKFDLHHGDCLEVLRSMADNSVDSVVTDPPYGLSFMGKKWDYDVPGVDVWAECLRVLKPGGHLLAFAGTRTQHRMAVRIEDAGFEIRDMIAWVYSSGFPKSHNLDNFRGKLTCDCSNSSLPYTHEKSIPRESEAKCEVHPLREPDVSQAVDSCEGGGEVLQQGVQEQGTHRSVPRPQSSEGEQGQRKCGMERRCDDLQKEGELQEHSLHSSARLDAANGAQGRLCDGAQVSNGTVVWIPVEQDGVCASPRSQPTEQQQNESGALAGQPESQTSGAWPICGGCGKPVLPKGLGTALKPALEPITVARKPLIGNVAANVLAYGTGGLNIDGCRVAHNEELRCGTGGIPARHDETKSRTGEASEKRVYSDVGGTNFAMKPGPRGGDAMGRWPANLIHDGSDEVTGLFPTTTSGAMKSGTQRAAQDQPGSVCYGTFGGNATTKPIEASSGSAARFFYCAKASKRDRDEGLEGFEAKATAFGNQAQAELKRGNLDHDDGKSGMNKVKMRQNSHPTVKPTALMRYLCRLVTPPGGVVLDPFTGSGSTGKAAILEGFQFVGIEREAEYVAIARARIEAAATPAPKAAKTAAKNPKPKPETQGQSDLFEAAA